MQNRLNIGYSQSGKHYPVDCMGEASYEIGPKLRDEQVHGLVTLPVYRLTITALSTTQDIPVKLPATGYVTDCGSGVMTVLAVWTDENGDTYFNGRCPSKAYYDRAARHQISRTAGERLTKALSEREAVSNGIPPRAQIILSDHFR